MNWLFGSSTRQQSVIEKEEKVFASNNDDPIPSDELWDLVLDRDWEGAINHASSYPQDAKFQDGHWDETPLYLSLQFQPPASLIRAIILAYPAAVSIKSRENQDLPVHLACRYQAPIDVLQELVTNFPATVLEQTRWGKTPLMLLFEFKTPTALGKEFWAKVILLLNAAAHSNNGNSNTANDSNNESKDSPLLVHSAVSLGARCCPIEVLEYVIEKYPDDVAKRDKDGKLPLHIAIGPTSWSKTTKRKYKPREQSFITRLLQANPTAARATLEVAKTIHEYDRGERDASIHKNEARIISVQVQRYPLHTALSNRHCWTGGIRELLLAAPDVLTIRDPITKLYPFQLAAVPVGETTVELDTVYMLLRCQPTLISRSS